MAVIQIALIINKQHEVFAPTPELERPPDNVQISHQVGNPHLPQCGSQEVLQTTKAYHRQEPMINVLCFLMLLIYLCTTLAGFAMYFEHWFEVT